MFICYICRHIGLGWGCTGLCCSQQTCKHSGYELRARMSCQTHIEGWGAFHTWAEGPNGMSNSYLGIEGIPFFLDVDPVYSVICLCAGTLGELTKQWLTVFSLWFQVHKRIVGRQRRDHTQLPVLLMDLGENSKLEIILLKQWLFFKLWWRMIDFEKFKFIVIF